MKIYAILNKLNGKLYIGQTTRSIEVKEKLVAKRGRPSNHKGDMCVL